jgi:uncharacterized RDD family membrane protein YckC
MPDKACETEVAVHGLGTWQRAALGKGRLAKGCGSKFMFDTSGFQRGMSRPLFAPASLPSEALAGVRSRRILALCIDFVVVSCLSFLIWLALLLATFGLSLFVLPPLFPLVAFFYNGLSVSGPRMATPGMRIMDLQMRLMDGDRVPFLNAAIHAVLFYVSWLFPAIFLVSLLASDKRCLHDMLAGVIVVRRPLRFI